MNDKTRALPRRDERRIALIHPPDLIAEFLEPIAAERGLKLRYYEATDDCLHDIAIDRPGLIFLGNDGEGLAACRSLRQLLEEACPPIIMLCESGDDSSWQGCFAAGASEALAIPLKPGELAAKISHFLGEGPGATSPRSGGIPSIVDGFHVLETLEQRRLLTRYRVSHADASGPLTLTLLTPDQSDPVDALRFRRELDLIIGLDHPALPSFHSSGRCLDFLYFVSKPHEGVPLPLARLPTKRSRSPS